MYLPKVLIIWSESEIDGVRAIIEKECTLKVRDYITYLPLSTKYLKSKKHELSERNELLIIETTATNNFSNIFFDRRIPIHSDESISDITPSPIKANSRQTLIKEVLSCLKTLNLHWESYALQEWSKSSIKGCSPNRWVEQFSRLGHTEVGKNLLKLLHVINDDSLRKSFSSNKEEFIGLDIEHCFFFDQEKGSSSIVVQNILEKMYTQNAHRIEDEKIDMLATLRADRLYIYEDGLWSGVELVRRIKAIFDSELYQNTHMHFYFKFSALSDVGLVAARFLTKSLKTSRFHFIPSSNSQYFEFFGKEKIAKFDDATADHDKQRIYLDTLIEPYAFKFDQIWGESRAQAMSVCEEIGQQLLTPFLTKKYGNEKAVNKIKTWKLGAMNFASTIVFSSSIPKPVLPLLWLEGKVKIGNLEVDWQPLFRDARRTGTDNTN